MLSNHDKSSRSQRSFTQSTDDLKSKYKRLMTEFHPDRHASSSEEEKSLKASTASNVTRVYDIIANPLSRALHLLELNNAAIGEDDSVSLYCMNYTEYAYNDVYLISHKQY